MPCAPPGRRRGAPWRSARWRAGNAARTGSRGAGRGSGGRPGHTGRARRGRDGDQQARGVRVRGPRRVAPRRVLDDLAGVHDRDAVGDLRTTARSWVIRSTPTRSSLRSGDAARGSGPARSRRAPWSARRDEELGLHRAPSRSWSAGACHRTARAGRVVAAGSGDGMRTPSVDRELAPPAPGDVAVGTDVSTSCAPTVNSGSSAVSGSWKTIEILSPRSARSRRVGSPAEVPGRQAALCRRRAPRTGGGGGGGRRGPIIVLPEPDSPTRASVSPRASVR